GTGRFSGHGGVLRVVGRLAGGPRRTNTTQCAAATRANSCQRAPSAAAGARSGHRRSRGAHLSFLLGDRESGQRSQSGPPSEAAARSKPIRRAVVLLATDYAIALV